MLETGYELMSDPLFLLMTLKKTPLKLWHESTLQTSTLNDSVLRMFPFCFISLFVENCG